MNPKQKFSEDEEVESGYGQYLPYVVNSSVSNEYVFPIDQEIIEPAYYRNLVQVLDNATESDTVFLKINSPGGRADTCSTILYALENTQATTVAEIVCDCHSAASLIALSTDILIVSDYANMLCHSARFGTGGKSVDVLSSAVHHKKIADTMLRNVYKDFLTDQEIEDVINGKELYLDAEDIKTRATKRVEIRNAAMEEVEEVLEITPPKKQSKRKD